VSLAVAALHAREAALTGATSFWRSLRATAGASVALGVGVLLPLAVALASYPTFAARVLGW
jgi:hypothetical protein